MNFMKLLPILIPILVVLLVLYLSYRFTSVGNLLRNLGSWSSRIFVHLAVVCLHIAGFFHRGFLQGIAWPEAHNEDEHHASGRIVIRVIYLLTGLVLIFSEYPLQRYRLAHYLGLVVTPSNLPLDVFMALLPIVIPGVWLLLLAECIGLLPEWAGLFPLMHKKKWLPWGIGVVSLLMLIAAGLFIYSLMIYGQCDVLGLSCATDATNQVNIAGLFGVVLMLSAAVGVWSVILGTLAIVGCCCGLLYCVFWVFHAVCALVADSIMGLSRVTQPSQPSLRLSYTMAPVAAHLPLALPSGTSNQDPPFTFTQEEITTMDSRYRDVTIIGYGPAASLLVPLGLETVLEVGAGALLLNGGMVDMSRPHRTEIPVTIPGMQIITPPEQEFTKARADETFSPATAKLANYMHQKVIDSYTHKQTGIVIAICDLTVLPQVTDPLRMLSRRLPHQTVVLLCQLPPADMLTPDQLEACRTILVSLHTEGAVATSILVDPFRSPYAHTAGTQALEKALVQTCISLCAAPFYDENNLTIGEVVKRLGAQSPLAGISFSALPVATGKTPPIWQAVQVVAPRAGERGTGSATDLLIQAKACTQSSLLDATSLATPAAIDLQKTCFAVYNLPYNAKDKRFTETAPSLQNYLSHTFQQVHGIMTCVNGIPYPQLETKYRVSVSCLYPLPLGAPLRQEHTLQTLTTQATPASSLQAVSRANGRKA